MTVEQAKQQGRRGKGRNQNNLDQREAVEFGDEPFGRRTLDCQCDQGAGAETQRKPCQGAGSAAFTGNPHQAQGAAAHRDGHQRFGPDPQTHGCGQPR